jgi:CubicO group peptidase (beta-lactamase class C family)
MDFSDAIAKARATVLAEFAPKVPGLSVAVAAGGALVWSEAFGWADLDAQRPATTETRFRIGSVAKPLTATGLALLVERGQMDLDAPVHRYLPDLPPHHAPTTIRMLAGHLTGIRNYRGTEAVSNRAFPNLRSGLKIFEDDPLEAPPGTRYSYSSYNYNVLGAAMEAAARQDFLVFMDDNVIRPLGLTNTVPDRAGAVDPQRAQFYEISPAGKFLIAPRVNASYAWPSGGYLSTTEDLVRFGLAHCKPGFLKPESLRLLFTSQVTFVPTGYGVGWFVGGPLVYHAGDSFGGMAVLVLHPPSRTVVALACNAGQGVLRNALRKKTVSREAEQFLPKRDAVAVNITKIFAQLSKKPGGPQ